MRTAPTVGMAPASALVAGHVVAASGPVVRAAGLAGGVVGEVVRVGPKALLGEIIRLERDEATIQVYEETAGLRIGDPVMPTTAPLRAWLGPGLLGATFDGLQRPLDRLAAAGTWMLLPGGATGMPAGPTGDGSAAAATDGVGDDTGRRTAAGPTTGPGPALGADRRWTFEPERSVGDEVGPGDRLGSVAEGPIRHCILVPPDASRGRLLGLAAGSYAIDEAIGQLETTAGTMPLLLAHRWPVRLPRPVRRRLPIERPLLTGQRVIDMLFPVARGGATIIPGGFGTGKTVVEQAVARWSDADIVVYVGCGERGNEMAELLASFPDLVDPRTGGPLLARTVLIANTSNMPVAAREASVLFGATIAEYFRDQGYDVALLADSTSRWAEALREISGRLEELPGEEGFPAYLGSRLAGFYERAGRVVALGEPERTGSITTVGAISPPGGDFSEPVTQASLRLAGAFWALDAELAHARHFPAIDWTRSFSLYVGQLAPWYEAALGPGWRDRRGAAIELLVRERQLLEVVALVGADALPDQDRVALEVARLVREAFLQQHAFDPVDASRPLGVQYALLGAVLAVRTGLETALARGETLAGAMEAPELDELRRARTWSGEDVGARLDALAERLADPRPRAAV